MSKITAKVIADSISSAGKRITTIEIKFHRFILPEFNTHRMFSRNFSSSRAIPVKKLIDQVRTDPATPVHWGKNQAGMQASVELSEYGIAEAQQQWRIAANQAADRAQYLSDMGLHKQACNRVLEPYMWVTGIVTATEFSNWFELRAHEDAQPEIHELAIQMRIAREASKPKLLQSDEWHLPYVTQEERNDQFFKANEDNAALLRKVSAARCCRVSYLKHDGTVASISDDLDLCDKLVGSKPLHASPFEHQATPDTCWHGDWDNHELHGNFKGWIQYRKLIENSFK